MDNPIPPTSIAPPAPVSPVIPSLPLKSSLFPTFFVVLILILLGATSVFAYQNWRLNQKLDALIRSQFTTTPSPTPQAEPDLAPPDTANWKTYTNPQNQYSVKYPPEVTMSDYREGMYSGIHLLLIGPTQTASGRIQTSLFDGVSIKTLVITNVSISLRDYAEQRRVAESQSAPKDDPQPTVSKLTEVLIGGKSGHHYAVDDQGRVAQVNLVSLNGNILQIVTRSAGSPKFERQYINLIDQILSTFKFTK